MCGLVGMAGDLTHEARTRIFKDMLDVSQVRGRDSTGVIKIDKKMEYDWCKQVGSPVFLYDTKHYEDRIERGSVASILIGHTRSKTIGEVNRRSAHPFDYPDQGICGVHNGTLRGYYNLDTYTNDKVDSEILYGHLAKNGVRETFPKLEGAYACVWWDNNDKTVNFIRNDERPLYFTWSKDMKMMFWASEIWMFGTVSRKIALWDGGESKQVYVALPIHTLYSFQVKPDAKSDEKVLHLKPIEKLEPEKKVHSYTGPRHYQGGGVWTKDDNGHYTRNRPSDEKGGEVSNPFQKATLEVVEGRLREEYAKAWGVNPDEVFLLDDPLPPVIGGADDKNNSRMSNVSFLKHSASSSDSTTPSTSSNNFQKKTLCLPDKTSTNSPSNNSAEPSNVTTRSSSKRKLSIPQLSNGVSFRTVAGIDFITDNTNKKEFSIDVFYQNTEGKCAFCKEKISDVHQVAEFLNEKKFLCKSCLVEPKDNVIVLPAKRGSSR